MNGDTIQSRRRFLQYIGVSGVAIISGCGEAKTDQRNEPPSNEGHRNSPASNDELAVMQESGVTKAVRPSTGEVIYSDSSAGAVIQHAIDEANEGGTVRVRSGTYTVGPTPIRIKDVNLQGDGPDSTILKLTSGLGQSARSILVVLPEAHNIEITGLAIDGNEANNRGYNPFPKSPHAHGIVVPSARNDSGATRISLTNLRIHDTIRSNIVMGGQECEISNVRLSNAATDHWLYATAATNCTITGVDCSGFARSSGITLGVGQKPCHGNTFRDLTFHDVTTTPIVNDAPEGVFGRYPALAVVQRPVPEGYGNTIRNITIDATNSQYGQGIAVRQPQTRIDTLTYRGRYRMKKPLVHVMPQGEGATVEHIDMRVTDTGDRFRTFCASAASNVTVTDAVMREADSARLVGFAIRARESPVKKNTFQDATIETSGPILFVRASQPVTGIVFVDIQDINGSGVRIKGEKVEFAEREVDSGPEEQVVG